MNKLKLKVIGVSEYHGIGRTGNPFVVYNLEVDYNGTKCKIKTYEGGAKPGDYVEVEIGIKKSVYGAELVVVVNDIIPADAAAEMGV